MLKAACYLLKCECLLLWRHSQDWLYPLGFFLIVISLFPLAFTPDAAFLQTYIPGGIWIAALLACLLSIQTLFSNDIEAGHLEQLLLSTKPLSLLLACKLFAQWLVNCLPLILLTPLLGIFFQLPFNTTLLLALSLLLGTPILILVGGFSVALTLGLRQQGMMISLMILPLVIPVLIFSVSILTRWQLGLDILGPIALMTGLMLLAILFIPFAIAAALRLSADD